MILRMPASDTSLIKIVSEGGILMGPLLLIVLTWVSYTMAFILNRNRSLKSLISLLLFPLAFGLLAVAHWFLYSHTLFLEMERSGYPEIMQYIRHGLVVTRSGIVILACGGTSLIVTGLLFMLPTTGPKIEQHGTFNGG